MQNDRPNYSTRNLQANSCGLLKHKNGCNYEIRSDRTHVDFFHCFCASCAFSEEEGHNILVR